MNISSDAFLSQEKPVYKKGVDDWFEYLQALDAWKSWVMVWTPLDAHAVEYKPFWGFVAEILDHRDPDNKAQDLGGANICIPDYDKDK